MLNACAQGASRRGALVPPAVGGCETERPELADQSGRISRLRYTHAQPQARPAVFHENRGTRGPPDAGRPDRTSRSACRPSTGCCRAHGSIGDERYRRRQFFTSTPSRRSARARRPTADDPWTELSVNRNDPRDSSGGSRRDARRRSGGCRECGLGAENRRRDASGGFLLSHALLPSTTTGNRRRCMTEA